MRTDYQPLFDHLAALARRGDDSVRLSFDELAHIVPGLPDSARRHRAWWSNGSQPHCWAWREAGWLVDGVSYGERLVHFVRERGTVSPRVANPNDVAVPPPAMPAAAPSQVDAPPANPTVPPFTPSERNGVRAPRGRVEISPTSLPVLDRVAIGVEFEWRDAGLIALDAAGDLVFPLLPAAPGAYRMTSTGAPSQQRPKVYIGETDDFRRRATNYRNPGPSQDTNIRMNASLKAHLKSGGTVRFAIAASGRIRAATADPAVEPVPLDLSRKAPRLLLESAAIVLAQLAGDVDLENLG